MAAKQDIEIGHLGACMLGVESKEYVQVHSAGSVFAGPLSGCWKVDSA
jgi:hypothetical protein